MNQQEHWNKYFTSTVKTTLNISSYCHNVQSLITTVKEITKHYDDPLKKVLDVGGGTGDKSRFYFPKSNLHLVDISSKAIEIAKRSHITTHLIDIETTPLPYKKNYFDFVISSEVVEHIKNIDLYLAEICRVLKPKGYFLISTPNICSLSSRIRVLAGYTPTTSSFDPTHIQILNFQKLSIFLKKKHLRIVTATTNQAYFPTTKTLIPIPFIHLFNINLGEQIILLAKKTK